MNEYSEECIYTFLKNQGQLFDEPVAESYAEAEAFLEDCMAVVVDSIGEVRDYMEESGMDVDGSANTSLASSSSPFVMPSTSIPLSSM